MTFTVDGIVYDRDRACDHLYLPRPMFELIDDNQFSDAAADMFHSDPPTDYDLTKFVDLGLLPPS